MFSLNSLEETSQLCKRRKRVGRGPGSGMGKTSGRGHKGAGSRSGYRRRATYEGGQMRLFRKLPQRGFSRARFRKSYEEINLGQLERFFQEGEEVNQQTLRNHGLISGKVWGIKLLAKGSLSKKVGAIDVDAISASARQVVEGLKIPLTLSLPKEPKSS